MKISISFEVRKLNEDYTTSEIDLGFSRVFTIDYKEHDPDKFIMLLEDAIDKLSYVDTDDVRIK
jgi:hypothetical protein